MFGGIAADQSGDSGKLIVSIYLPPIPDDYRVLQVGYLNLDHTIVTEDL
jgi:hypothetical protein